MKQKQMFCVFKILILLAVAASSARAENELRCEAQARKTEVLPFEPVELLLSVRNTTDQVQTKKEDWSVGSILVGKPKDGSNGWDWSSPFCWHGPGVGPPPPIPPWHYPKLQFQPKELKTFAEISALNAIPRSWEERLWLEKPGRIAVRGMVGMLTSEPIIMTVLEPKGVDAEAARMLKESRLACFFSEKTIVPGCTTETEVKRLREFVEKFKGGLYADYATLGLGLVHLKGVEGKKDLAAAQSYFKSLSQREGPLKEWAAYYDAVCGLQTEDAKSAQQVLEDIVAHTKDLVLGFKAKLSLQNHLAGTNEPFLTKVEYGADPNEPPIDHWLESTLDFLITRDIGKWKVENLHGEHGRGDPMVVTSEPAARLSCVYRQSPSGETVDVLMHSKYFSQNEMKKIWMERVKGTGARLVEVVIPEKDREGMRTNYVAVISDKAGGRHLWTWFCWASEGFIEIRQSQDKTAGEIVSAYLSRYPSAVPKDVFGSQAPKVNKPATK